MCIINKNMDFTNEISKEEKYTAETGWEKRQQVADQINSIKSSFLDQVSSYWDQYKYLEIYFCFGGKWPEQKQPCSHYHALNNLTMKHHCLLDFNYFYAKAEIML